MSSPFRFDDFISFHRAKFGAIVLQNILIKLKKSHKRRILRFDFGFLETKSFLKFG